MEKEQYYEIIDNILMPIVDYTAHKMESTTHKNTVEKIRKELKQVIYEKYLSIHSDYENTKEVFKEKYMKYPKHKIDRFKVSALFCFVFINILKKNDFFKKNSKLKYTFVRNVAVNTATAIVESFIMIKIKRDKKNKKYSSKYSSHLEEYGIAKPIKNYINPIIEKFVLIEKEQSYFLLANIFCTIEDKFKDKFNSLPKRGNL